MVLEKETALFEQHREEWRRQHPGKFVVIGGDRVVGFYDSLESALVAGTRQFGLKSFLARSVSEPDQEFAIPAMALGVLDACPAHDV
jgi:hypothetical protein